MGSGSRIEMAGSPDPTARGEHLLRQPRGHVWAVGAGSSERPMCVSSRDRQRRPATSNEAGHLDCWVGGIGKGEYPRERSHNGPGATTSALRARLGTRK
jgi:hypothetical protein